MSAAEKLKALDEGLATGPLSVKEYADGSAYIEHAERGWMVIEFRENKTNRLDDMVRLCEIRNALPQIVAVVKAAQRMHSMGLIPNNGVLWDLEAALAALDGKLNGAEASPTEEAT